MEKENSSDMDIVEMYRGLWKIEETFKVTKGKKNRCESGL